jgi:SAM-dependent methyltransferase
LNPAPSPPHPEYRLKAKYMGTIKLVPASTKFDVLSSNYDSAPDDYYAQWDGTDLIKAMGNIDGKRILDIGCGNGRLMKKLQFLGAEVVGIDISKKMTYLARRAGNNAICIDILSYETTEQFDMGVLVLTLNYFENKQKLFIHCSRLLKPSGILAISNDLQTKDVAIPDGDKIIASPYFPISRGDCCNELIEAGFAIKSAKDLFWDKKFEEPQKDQGPIGYLLIAVNMK